MLSYAHFCTHRKNSFIYKVNLLDKKRTENLYFRRFSVLFYLVLQRGLEPRTPALKGRKKLAKIGDFVASLH